MAVVTLPTRSSAHWAEVEDSLHAALPIADHPRLSEHGLMARELLAGAGRPTQPWANRIAAIAVIAGRRADTAPTMARRAAYLEVAEAAAELLLLADLVHDVRADDYALSVLAQLGRPEDALI